MAYADDVVLMARSPKALSRMPRELPQAAEEGPGRVISTESRKSCWSSNFKIPARCQPETFMTLPGEEKPVVYHTTEEGLPLLGGRWCLD